MTDEINLTINGKPVSAPAGTTIHKAALQAGVEIPTICYHDFCTANALCRLCVVEVTGARTLVASCVAQISEGMDVQTKNERVQHARKMILEMLASTVDLTEAPDILEYMREYGADADRYQEAEERRPLVIDDNSLFVRDYAKCILCWRCVQVCAEDAQYAFAINFSGRGFHSTISTFYDQALPETTCVFCGQCIGVCPTGALKPKREWLLEQGYTPETIMQLTRPERKKRTRGADAETGGSQ